MPKIMYNKVKFGVMFIFGYIKPVQGELKVNELEVYKSTYCGLCKSLGKEYGGLARLTLSYDFTFLSLILEGLKEECSGFEKKICLLNPLKKKVCLCPSEKLDFTSSVAMIMLYYKLKDDIYDKSFFKKIPLYFLLPTFASARNKAKKKYPKIDSLVEKMIKDQQEIEKKKLSIEQYCEPSSICFGEILKSTSDDKNTRRVLYRFGFLLGRYIFLIDAIDDLDKDKKNNEFNPFLEMISKDGEEKTISYATELINITLGDLSLCFELLSLYRNKAILDNIVYLGLKNALENVISRRKND
jgi:hypothetical protein